MAALSVLFAFVLIGVGDQRAIRLGVAVGAFSVTFGVRQWSMAKTVLTVEDGVLLFRGLVRTRTLSTPQQPARVVRVTLASGPRRHDGEIWTGPGGSIMLMTAAWGEDRLDALARRLGATTTVEPEPVALPELATRYPGVVPWYGAHPVAAGIVAFVVLMAAALWLTA